jgi:glutamate synthase domain-containing protein 3
MGDLAETIYSTRDINSAIRAQIKKGATTRIEGLSGQDNIAVGFETEAKITIIGNAGDFFGALNAGPNLNLKGNAGRFLGDTMKEGTIIVDGMAKDGVGTHMTGGLILVKGHSGSKVGAGMKGGVIIIDDDVEDSLGLYCIRGDIIVTGNTGKNVGVAMLGGNIFVNGKIGGLSGNAKMTKPTKSDKMRLTRYLSEQNVLGEFKFKKVTSEIEIPKSDLTATFAIG